MHPTRLVGSATALLLTAAMLGAASPAVAGPTPAPSPDTTDTTGTSAARAGCSDLAKGFLRIAATEKTTYKQVRYSGSGSPEYSPTEVRRGPVDVGTMTIRVKTCKRDGSWRPLDVDVAQPHEDLTLTVEGKEVTRVEPAAGNTGFAIVHRRTSGKAVELAALRCTESPTSFKNGVAKTLKGLLSIPLPTSYAASVAAYAASIALPDAPEDKYWCGRIGSVVSIKVGITDKGRPFLRWGALPGKKVARTATTTYQQPCSTVIYCADIYDEIVTMRRP